LNAEIIAVGTEIIIGQILNTNSKYLSEKLADHGIDVFFHTSVGDNMNRIIDALKIASERSDIVLITGGLGPTADDLTKEALAKYLQLPLICFPDELTKLREQIEKRNIIMLESHNKQADFIPGSIILNNENGTAPGMAFQKGKISYIVLPGPPRELETMFVKYAIPWITGNLLGNGYQKLYSKLLKFAGITESNVEEKLKDLIQNQTTPTLATYVGVGEVHVRISAKAPSEDSFIEGISGILQEIEKRIGKYKIGEDGESSLDLSLKFIRKHHLSISTAESCTAGLLSASFTDLPGASNFYYGSIIAYSNFIKKNLLNIPADVLDKHGAVSEETAVEMAKNISAICKTDIGIAITGIAGPEGGSSEKPVGLVYVALYSEGKTQVVKNIFRGRRDYIRAISVKTAHALLLRYLKEKEK